MLVRQFSDRTGCHVETVRYYEKIGLLPAPARTASGYRRYSDADVERLGFIMRCRNLGFGIEETRSLLALTADSSRPCGDVDELVQQHLSDIERRQAELQRMAEALRSSLHHCGRTTVDHCEVSRRLHGAAADA